MRQLRFSNFLGLGSILAISLAFADANPQDSRRFYFFREPLRSEVSLNVPIRTFLYTSSLALSAGEIAGAYYGAPTQPELAAAMLTLYQIPNKVLSLPAASFGTLKTLSAWKRSKSLRPLLENENVDWIFMVASRKLDFSWLQVVREESHRYIFVTTLGELNLPPGGIPGLGEAIEIQQPELATMTLRLELNGQRSTSEWSVSIQDLLKKKRHPSRNHERMAQRIQVVSSPAKSDLKAPHS